MFRTTTTTTMFRTTTTTTTMSSPAPTLSSSVPVTNQPSQQTSATAANNSFDAAPIAAAAARAAAMAAAGKGVGVNLGTVVRTGAGHHIPGAAIAAAKAKASNTSAVVQAPAVAVRKPNIAAVTPALANVSTPAASNVSPAQLQHLQHMSPHSPPPTTAARPSAPLPTNAFPPAAPLQQSATNPQPATTGNNAIPTATTAKPSTNQQQPSSPAAPTAKIPPNVTFPLKRSCAAMGLARDGKPLTEKKLRRLEKNRLSARECRRRKREAAQNLEKEINVLEGENLRLRLQLQIGEEAEKSSNLEQERLMEGLDDLLKSGSASESDIYATIEQYKEKFADYGRNRRSAIEFHLRNLARLLMPTTTTSVAIRALHGGAVGSVGSSSSGGSSDDVENGNAQPKVGSGATVTDLGDSAADSSSNSSTSQLEVKIKSEGLNPVVQPINNVAANGNSAPEPKALFQYLVNYLEVTPSQAAALKDSRSVARELDSALADSLAVLEELRNRLTKCGEDLEAEFNSVRAILSPTQAAKFLIWVANNGACMHMLNELWSKVYPDLGDAEEVGMLLIMCMHDISLTNDSYHHSDLFYVVCLPHFVVSEIISYIFLVLLTSVSVGVVSFLALSDDGSNT
mmetsp:Transcript_28402/g.42470  ORF Transcript_28402/g.42470 Transcript_28402/m.42470 type:complete len:626 (+) Transcript_28402:474-2351(+)